MNALASLLVAAPLAAAAATLPPAGTFGFDWLKPETTRCESVSDPLLKRFRRCERQEGAFGLVDRVYVCRVDGRSEYLVFASRTACLRNLDTMRANGP